MLNNISYLEKEAVKLKNIKGNVKGEVFKNYFNYILDKKGEEGVRELTEMMEKLKWPINYSKINSYQLYPDGQSILIILVAKTIFNWSEQDIFDMGYAIPQRSFIIKIIMHYFVSIDNIIKKAPTSWKKHYDFGELKIAELNKEKKYCIARLTGYKTHPIICIYLRGYFLRIMEYLVISKNIVMEETKCVYKGDSYHEYRASWQ